MDQQKIDRLFREKLDQMEVSPSSNAWSQVEKQIRPKKTPLVYWIAASVTLFLISWIVWPEESDVPSMPMVSDASHPVNQQTPDFVLPEIERVEVVKKVEFTPKRATIKEEVQPVQQFANNAENRKAIEIIEEAIPELETVDEKTAVAVVEEPIFTNDVKEETETSEKPVFSKVKITYIASSRKPAKEEIQKNDSTGVLKKFIAFTEKIDPGNVLADMKTAKDNLFNGGLKNKKDRSAP